MGRRGESEMSKECQRDGGECAGRRDRCVSKLLCWLVCLVIKSSALLIVNCRLVSGFRGDVATRPSTAVWLFVRDVVRLGLPHVAGIISPTSSTWCTQLFPAGGGLAGYGL